MVKSEDSTLRRMSRARAVTPAMTRNEPVYLLAVLDDILELYSAEASKGLPAHGLDEILMAPRALLTTP
jgi:hypothetical protein